jgi:tetratricopeptide (TPR) repeat protein
VAFSSAPPPSTLAIFDSRVWELDESVLTEPIPGTGQVALWRPTEHEEGPPCWERVAPLERAGFAAAPGLRAVPATLIRARQLGGLFRRWFRRTGGQPWILPNGRTAEQLTDRRKDLLLIWSEDTAMPIDLDWVQSRWADQRVQRLGKNLYLVYGKGDSEAGQTATPVMEEAWTIADRLLKDARAAGNRHQEASALADLGAIYLQHGKTDQAIQALGEAHAIARDLGDRPRVIDILGNMGAVSLAVGLCKRAMRLFEIEQKLAHEAGDRFAEKLALERIGMAHARMKHPALALAAFEQALALAQELGHRKHAADLLWSTAIQHAELQQRDQAIANGQAALDLWRQMGNPQAAWYAEHLRKYQAGETMAPQTPTDESEPAVLSQSLMGSSIMAGLWAGPETGPSGQALTEGPGLLRMAVSAAKSMAKFVGSGFETTPAQTLEHRLQTCAACEHHTGVRCRLCGCFTSAKVRLAHEECPIGKWTAEG